MDAEVFVVCRLVGWGAIMCREVEEPEDGSWLILVGEEKGDRRMRICLYWRATKCIALRGAILFSFFLLICFISCS